MNRLTRTLRSQIIHLLCEGTSIRAITRLTGVSKNTVAKLLVDAGKACAAYHDEHVRGLKAKRIQVDEIWSFVYAKQKNVATAKRQDMAHGDVWTWTAIDADSKLVIAYLVGARDGFCAELFMRDLESRILADETQLTTDQLNVYLKAVDLAFKGSIDYAMLHKVYKGVSDGKYSPAECVGTKQVVVTGDPNPKHISTSFVERANLTMRMSMRRFTRLTNGFSKKFENHAAMVSIYTVWYNWVRIHKTLRVTPAMEAKLTDRVWSLVELVELMDEVAKPVPQSN